MYNIPILAPEDRRQQPIDTSDGYSKVYGSSISTDTDGPNSKYWIEFAGRRPYTGEKLYNAYKGSFPDKTERIMDLSLGAIDNLSSAIDKEIPHVELCYKGAGGKYSIRTQQEELGKVDLSYGRIDYDPFFELILISYCFCGTYVLMSFLIFNAIFAGISILVSLAIILVTSNYEFEYVMVPVTISIVSTVLTLILYYCFCFSPRYKENGVKRLHRVNVNDKKTRKVVAEVYNLRGSCFSHDKDLEILCHRTLTMPELMGLFSLAVLSLTNGFLERPNDYSNYPQT